MLLGVAFLGDSFLDLALIAVAVDFALIVLAVDSFLDLVLIVVGEVVSRLGLESAFGFPSNRTLLTNKRVKKFTCCE